MPETGETNVPSYTQRQRRTHMYIYAFAEINPISVSDLD